MSDPITTHSSADETRDRGQAARPVLRWVFPETGITPIVDGAILGRDPACGARLVGSQISRRHARLAVGGPVASIEDLGSRNGTFVNGARRADAALEPGTVVRVGEWVGLVDRDGGAEPGFGPLVEGWLGGAVLRAAVAPARQIAPSSLPVIVQGETGAGKEGLARAIHAWSGRTGPFVAVNCATLPETLVSAELFGHRKGAFTGADRASPGLFRAAHGGTLFLDEILELPLDVQAKLLRVLEQREVLPVGETAPVAIDVRVVAATQAPLGVATSERRFRADLWARLDGLTVVVPPLRDRRADLVPLFRATWHAETGHAAPALTPKLVERLCLYDWPLNVRELVFLVKRLAALHGATAELTTAMLPERMGSPDAPDEPSERASRTPPRAARVPTSDESEFDALVAALRAEGGNLTRAAAAIGVTRARAYRLLGARPDFRRDELEPASTGRIERAGGR